MEKYIENKSNKLFNNFYNRIIKLSLIILAFVFILVLSGCEDSFGLSVLYKKQEMYVGEELLLQTNVDDISGEVVWSSSDESVATVDNDGWVKALKAGYTYIKVSSEADKLESQLYLIVKEKSGGDTVEKVQKKISVTGSQTIALESSTNSTIALTAKITNGSDTDRILWSSSDESVATVNENGLVTGLKIGVVTIKATLSSDNSVSDSIPIIVRTADGVQTIIENHIYTKSYIVDGEIDLSSISSTITEVCETYADSIIGVSNYQYSTTLGGGTGNLALSGVGSGVIIQKQASGDEFIYTVLTNHHVIKDNAQLKVYLGGIDKEVDATFVRSDVDLDLAIVTFASNIDFTVIEFAEVDSYKLGDFVLAIGCPTGYSYYGSVTFGVISYVDRKVGGETALFLQHDAPINPGNSGGALLDLNGKLIGINTLKIAKTEVEGMSFAVSMKTIKGFIENVN
ncbi:MAG: trypsin-like peptidase domain-containing protein [Bacilli bacterium]|nr:trypsin-like peptidase domain-containing protein [Bacilli bacterium]